MRKTVLNTALWTAMAVILGVSVSACSDAHEEILAVDRVDAAAAVARSKAPEAEDFGFTQAAADAVAETESATEEVAVATDGTEAEETVAEEATTIEVVTEEAEAVSEETPAADTVE